MPGPRYYSESLYLVSKVDMWYNMFCCVGMISVIYLVRLFKYTFYYVIISHLFLGFDHFIAKLFAMNKKIVYCIQNSLICYIDYLLVPVSVLYNFSVFFSMRHKVCKEKIKSHAFTIQVQTKDAKLISSGCVHRVTGHHLYISVTGSHRYFENSGTYDFFLHFKSLLVASIFVRTRSFFNRRNYW